jgi:hypothetical protein
MLVSRPAVESLNKLSPLPSHDHNSLEILAVGLKQRSQGHRRKALKKMKGDHSAPNDYKYNSSL